MYPLGDCGNPDPESAKEIPWCSGVVEPVIETGRHHFVVVLKCSGTIVPVDSFIGLPHIQLSVNSGAILIHYEVSRNSTNSDTTLIEQSLLVHFLRRHAKILVDEDIVAIWTEHSHAVKRNKWEFYLGALNTDMGVIHRVDGAVCVDFSFEGDILILVCVFNAREGEEIGVNRLHLHGAIFGPRACVDVDTVSVFNDDGTGSGKRATDTYLADHSDGKVTLGLKGVGNYRIEIRGNIPFMLNGAVVAHRIGEVGENNQKRHGSDVFLKEFPRLCCLDKDEREPHFLTAARKFCRIMEGEWEW